MDGEQKKTESIEKGNNVKNKKTITNDLKNAHRRKSI